MIASFVGAIVVLPTAVRAQNQDPQLSPAPAPGPAALAAPTLLVNGDFSGQDGWTSCSGADDSTWDLAEDHLRILGSGPACVYQTVRAAANSSYQLRCESYEEANGQQSVIRLSVLDQNWQSLDDVASPVAVGSSYTTAALTAPSGAAHVGVTFDSPGVGYSSYGGCELSNTSNPTPPVPSPPVPPPPPVDPNPSTGNSNLLVNGDFAAIAGWNNCDSAAAQPTIDDQLLIVASETSPACIYQEARLPPQTRPTSCHASQLLSPGTRRSPSAHWARTTPAWPQK